MIHHKPVADLGQVFLARWQSACLRHQAEFGRVTAREDHPGGGHGDTQTVFLRAPSWPLGPHSQDALDVCEWPAVQGDAEMRPLLAALEAVCGLPMARAMLVALRPGGVIGEHSDEGAYADRTERFHYPVFTAPEAISEIGGEQCHMSAGVLWWFDKTKPHKGRNSGAHPRVHLIFDGWRSR